MGSGLEQAMVILKGGVLIVILVAMMMMMMMMQARPGGGSRGVMGKAGGDGRTILEYNGGELGQMMVLRVRHKSWAREMRRESSSSSSSSASASSVRPSSSSSSSSSSGLSNNSGEAAPAGGILSSHLITLHEPFGQYFAVMELGTPAAQVALIMDTGSEVMWVQCQPCYRCGAQVREYPVFDPARSASYRPLDCSSSWCRDASSLAMGCHSSMASSQASTTSSHTTDNIITDPLSCFYNASYGDNSVSYGQLAMDTLTLPSLQLAGTDARAGNYHDTDDHDPGPRPVPIPGFVFGCGLFNTGVETDFNSSGLVGLDRGSHSLVSQLGLQRFSYCLPDRSRSIDATGYLSFGGTTPAQTIHSMLVKNPSPNPKPTAIAMQYATLLLNNKTGFLAQSYYLNLTAIAVAAHVLPITSPIDPSSGAGGTIIDTGTSLTSLVDPAYVSFRDAVRAHVAASATWDAAPIDIPQLPGFDSCYTVARGRGPPPGPPVQLWFDGGAAALQVEPGNLWLQVGFEGDRDVYCLAVGPAGQATGGRNVIGNFQQQDVLVEYDLQRGRVGFAHVRCSNDASSPRLSSLLLLLVLYYLPNLLLLISFL